jgi:CheY-like chemotaxis protein
MKYQPSVLLVDGNSVEEALVRKAIQSSETDCSLHVAKDGIDACKILFESGDRLPTFILIELNAPRINGFELLTLIRQRTETHRIPIIILSQNGDDSDVSRCLDLGANSYVQKDKDLDLYEARLKLLLYYWIAVNRNVNT